MSSHPSEATDDQRLPDGPAVVGRLMCLFAVADAGLSGDPSNAHDLVQRWNLAETLSSEEAIFLNTGTAISSQRIKMSWRIEAMIPLMWAIGLFDEMPPTDDQFDASYLADFWNEVPAGFGASATTRSRDEISDQAELIRHLHWTLRDARLNGVATSTRAEPGVVQERHHALNWLTGDSLNNWDVVATDT